MRLFWGVLVAVSYAATNLCLRAAAVQVDPFVGALFRTLPMVALSWGWLIARQRVGDVAGAGWGALLPLIAAGLLFNVTGNGSFQLGLALTGLTVTLPVTAGALLWGGALFGWWLMRERVSRRAALGLCLLVVSLPLLAAGGGGGVGPPGAVVPEAVAGVVGALAAALAGVSYGGGNALLRRAMLTHHVAGLTALAPVSTAGCLALLLLVLLRLGPDAFAALPPDALAWLLLASACNVVATLSLTRALTLLPVARVNALNTLQTAVSALGGVAFFAEPVTATLIAGLLLSLVGATLAQQGRARQ